MAKAKAKVSGKKNDVSATSLAYDEMALDWDLLHDLLGHTRAMIKAATKWLPKEDKETIPNYQSRLKRSVLYEAFADTIDKGSAAPFSQPITMNGELPVELKPIEKNTDGTGKTLQQLGHEWFDAAETYGISHMLIDFPQTGGGLNRAEEENLGVMPRFVHIKPTNLLAWATRPGPTGEPILTEIRVLEISVERIDNSFVEQEVLRIRIYREKDWELWELKMVDGKAHQEWQRVTESTLHSFGSIPLVTLYFKRKGFMIGDPPFMKIANLNKTHWQSSSDQRNILRMSRFGLLFAAGFTTEELKKGLTVGPNSLVSTTASKQDADLKYVESEGKAIGAGKEDLENLEAEMEALGTQILLKQRSGDIKATGQAIAEAKQQATIKSWAGDTGEGLTRCYQMAAQWMKVTLPDDFKVVIYDDFTIGFAGSKDIDSLLKMNVAGKITLVTFLREAQRRGFLSDNVNPEDEAKAVEVQDQDGGSGDLAGAGGDLGDDDDLDDRTGDDAGGDAGDAGDE